MHLPAAVPADQPGEHGVIRWRPGTLVSTARAIACIECTTSGLCMITAVMISSNQSGRVRFHVGPVAAIIPPTVKTIASGSRTWSIHPRAVVGCSGIAFLTRRLLVHRVHSVGRRAVGSP